MFQNKAQIARRESIKTLELPGPLSEPWTKSELRFRARNVRVGT